MTYPFVYIYIHTQSCNYGYFVKAIDEQVDAVCITRSLTYACWLLRDLSVQCDAIAPNMIKVKVKLTLEQAMKAQRGGRGIALLFL